MPQLSKVTIAQWDICPRRVLTVRSLLKLIYLIVYCILPYSLIKEYQKKTMVAALNLSSQTLVKSCLGLKSAWTTVPWTKVPLEN